MLERETIRISTDAPWNETPSLLEKKTIDVAIKPTYKDKCIIEFTDRLPQGLREVFENLDLATRSISGRDPRLYQFYASDVTADEAISIIDEWAKKEGIKLNKVLLSEADQE